MSIILSTEAGTRLTQKDHFPAGVFPAGPYAPPPVPRLKAFGETREALAANPERSSGSASPTYPSEP